MISRVLEANADLLTWLLTERLAMGTGVHLLLGALALKIILVTQFLALRLMMRIRRSEFGLSGLVYPVCSRVLHHFTTIGSFIRSLRIFAMRTSCISSKSH